MPQPQSIRAVPQALAAAGRSFLVGQNRLGQWLAVASEGSGGGIFASRESAIRYAATETNRRPMAVRLATRPIELRF